MEEWQFIFTREAENDLGKLDFSVRKRILEKIKWMRINFDKITPLPLGDKWRGFFKLRVGDWRIIYETEIVKKLIIIHYIGRRDKIYKRK
jgi:mRNA interferase RelE/StbE